MKKKTIVIIIAAVVVAVIAATSVIVWISTSNKKADNKSSDTVLFDQKISNSFSGLGVEWGVYEDTNKLAPNARERTIAALNRLKPALVRCMTNFDWIAYDFDGKNTDDVSDDEWKYDFSNKHMINCCEILDYCQNNGIKVAFGVWNIIGTTSGIEYIKDEDGNVTATHSRSVDWNMYQAVTSDPRWAKLAVDVMDYLVNNQGYTCIKWWVNSNEPNWTGAIGASKNAYNTYEKWQSGVLNVRKAFDDAGLTSVDIIGGDTTGFLGSAEYLPQIADNLSDKVFNYGVHMYISDQNIDKAKYQSNMTELYQEVKKRDSALGNSKDLIIWEGGLLDGKNQNTDCNLLITNFLYGLRMADYTLQSILAGVNGIVYWDLDDAMHFMYTENGMTAKEWGMFSTLNAAEPYMQEYRLWYHSSVILTNLLRPGSKIYTYDGSEENFRTIAALSNDNKEGGIVAINRGRATTKTFKLNKKVDNQSDKLYVYVYTEKNLRLGEDGFVRPTLTVSGNINDNITIELPERSMVVVSSYEL